MIFSLTLSCGITHIQVLSLLVHQPIMIMLSHAKVGRAEFQKDRIPETQSFAGKVGPSFIEDQNQDRRFIFNQFHMVWQSLVPSFLILDDWGRFCDPWLRECSKQYITGYRVQKYRSHMCAAILCVSDCVSWSSWWRHFSGRGLWNLLPSRKICFPTQGWGTCLLSLLLHVKIMVSLCAVCSPWHCTHCRWLCMLMYVLHTSFQSPHNSYLWRTCPILTRMICRNMVKDKVDKIIDLLTSLMQ